MFLIAILAASLDASGAASPTLWSTQNGDATADESNDSEGPNDSEGSAPTRALTEDDHASRVPLSPVSPGLGAPLRSTPAHLRDGRFELDLRVIEGVDSERSRASLLATYRVDERWTVGFEAAPEADEFSPLVVYRALDETASHPAVTFGTSTDRIGTPRGQAVWMTASKSVESYVNFPVSPYVGLAWGEFEDEFEVLGGLRIDWNRGISTTSSWDGESLHHALNVEFEDGWRVSLLAIDDDVDNETRFGMSIGRTL